MQLSDFDFDLESDFIAQAPVEPRDAAKLLCVLERQFLHHNILDLPSLLHPGDVLVLNNTKVIPVRLFTTCHRSSIEITLHKQHTNNQWYAFAKPSRKCHPGDRLTVSDAFYADIIDKKGGELLLSFNVEDQLFFSALEKYGQMPLPPYIKRKKEDHRHCDDKIAYQTVFAEVPGAVAAPTAGLHITASLLDQLKAKHIIIVTLTLHVGAGTYLPVKVTNIDDHVMHKEYGEISQESVDIIARAKQNGNNIVGVGTTTLRLLETASQSGVLKPLQGETDIFISPGFKFHCVDKLLTNFHLPKSTLFMLVAAFIGLDKAKEMVEEAKKNHYRFFSYGDACLLSCKDKQ